MDSPFADFKRLGRELCLSMIKLPNFIIDAAMGIVNKTVKSKNDMDINEIKPIEKAKLTKTPCIIIHAINDELINIQHSRDIISKYLGSNKKLIECDEGMLDWIKKEDVFKLNIWEGDRIFLEILVNDNNYFELKLFYKNDEFVGWEKL